jgi:hypothetical protein
MECNSKSNLDKSTYIEKFPIVLKKMTVKETKEYFLKRLYEMSLKFAGDKN